MITVQFKLIAVVILCIVVTIKAHVSIQKIIDR